MMKALPIILKILQKVKIVLIAASLNQNVVVKMKTISAQFVASLNLNALAKRISAPSVARLNASVKMKKLRMNIILTKSLNILN